MSLHVGCAQRGLEGGVVCVGRQGFSASSSSSSAGSRLCPVAVRGDRAEVGQGLLQLADAVSIVASRPILTLAELVKMKEVRLRIHIVNVVTVVVTNSLFRDVLNYSCIFEFSHKILRKCRWIQHKSNTQFGKSIHLRLAKIIPTWLEQF